MSEEISRALITLGITTLLVVFSAIGIQIFLILKDMRKSFKKVDHILGNMEDISDTLAHPTAKLSGIFSVIKRIFK